MADDGTDRFVLTGLPAGTLRLEASLFDRSGRHLVGEREVRVLAGETVDVVVALRPE